MINYDYQVNEECSYSESFEKNHCILYMIKVVIIMNYIEMNLIK